MLSCRENVSHAAFLRNARNSEETLRKEAIERTDLSHLKDTSRLISIDAVPGTVYKVETTGAMVSLNSAVGLIHFYCSQLPGDRSVYRQPCSVLMTDLSSSCMRTMDCFLLFCGLIRYAILRPEFSMEKHEKPGGHTEYSCRLQLPCNAPFEILEGPLCSSMRLAQQVGLK